MTDKPASKKKSDKRKNNRTDPDTRWKKGCPSPNPKGRPKGSKNQKTIYMETFYKPVTVGVDGKNVTMSLKEAGYKQVAQMSAGGNLKAFAIQKELDEKYDPPELVPPTPEEAAWDFATFESWGELREKFKAFKKKDEEDV